MDEHVIREMVSEVRAGRRSRRQFIQTMVGFGLTAPMATGLLGAAGPARAQVKAPPFTPTRRGGGGALKVLWWQAPTLLNPHFGTGTKDLDGSRIFYEPLAAYDPDGTLVPVLAAQVPTVQNGGLDKDGMWVTWQLKRGVTWHDGKPFTADDVIFNWEFAADSASASVWVGSTRDIARVEKLSEASVKVVFKNPTPYWHYAFCGNWLLVPKHHFDAYRGGKSREAPANVKPVGTGPYKFVEFKPGDQVRAEIFPAYHVANRPFFDTFEMKGGGDAASAARAVLQTAEYDYAWNMQVEDDVLRRMEQGGKGRVEIWPTGGIEHIQCNFSDPGREVDGERSNAKTTHPLMSDPALRTALNLLVDRSGVHEQIYGRQGQATANYLNAPPAFNSKSTRWEFSIDKANQALDVAGWKRGADGIRAKDGKRLKMLFQTSINAPRQKTQAIVKQAAAKAGIELELKSVVASVFFSSDPANPDTYSHFYADMQMYNTSTGVDPQAGMRNFTSWEMPGKDNKWAGRNSTRWKSEEFDRVYKAAETEMDPVKRAALFVRMNDLVIGNVVMIPVLWRNGVGAAGSKLRLDLSGWDSTLWRLPFWYRA